MRAKNKHKVTLSLSAEMFDDISRYAEADDVSVEIEIIRRLATYTQRSVSDELLECRIQQFHLNPDDYLVLFFDRPVTPEMAEPLTTRIKEGFSHDKIVCCAGGLQIEKMSIAEAEYLAGRISRRAPPDYKREKVQEAADETARAD